MISLRYGYGCRIKATLLDQFGEPLSLQRSKGICVSLCGPLGTVYTLPKANVRYNEFKNVIHIAVMPAAFAAEGDYHIVVNVLTQTGMVASRLTPICTVTPNANSGTAEIDMDLNLEALFLPQSASRTGASPQVSKDGTWLVYSDEFNGYVDTGIQVGYANLMARYDAKYAQILQPAIQATEKALQTAKAAEQAAADCNAAAKSAKEVSDTCAQNNEKAEELIKQMQGLIDDATECVFVDSVYDLPAVGDEAKVYIVAENNCIYRFNSEKVCYYKIGVGYNDGDTVFFDGNGTSDATNLNLVNLNNLKKNV